MSEQRGFRRVTAPASRLRWLVCLVTGHRWDVAPRSDSTLMRCVRCGMTAEPATPR